MPFSEIEEKRPVLLVTSSPAWQAVEGKLHFPIVAKVEPTEATRAHWDNLARRIEAQPAVVYAVGGGLVADTAKYLAFKFDLPLVVLPTALSVDAFMTSASGIRRNGCVVYIGTKPPETLILDLDVIAAAPNWIRAAGITDVLSIATGSWDWELAHRRGKNPTNMEFIPWVYDNAQSILNGVLDFAEAAGCGDKEGLKTLYDCLAMEVQLCNQIGHARPEEGSEHYFAYSIENLVGQGWAHGGMVGPGILIMAKFQGQDTIPLESALKSCHIPLDRIPISIIQETLKTLPAYVSKHNLAYGIAHELEKYVS
jgi:glycerol-1-phosphate dehydrogenase [NAD(P)+]